jgi:hypothetical protein
MSLGINSLNFSSLSGLDYTIFILLIFMLISFIFQSIIARGWKSRTGSGIFLMLFFLGLIFLLLKQIELALLFFLAFSFTVYVYFTRKLYRKEAKHEN